MKRDLLGTMLRVRQTTLDEAQKAVGEAYQGEQDALLRAETAAAMLEHEMNEATSLTGGDDAVETFARWLPVGRRLLKHAHDAQKEATSELDRARAVLALARSGVRTVELMIEQRTEERRQEENRREQRILDEVGRQRTPI